MKKLLVLSFAMAGATTLLAADPPVADFESYATGDMSVLTEENDLYFWDTTNPSQQTGSIVEYSVDGVTAPTDGNNKYFHVDSGSDTVLRNSVSHMTQDSVAEYEDLGKYMDAYVQFTAADEPESLTGNADKIRFYLLKSTDEQENETLTFHVCAGYLADSENSVTATDYEVTFGENFTPAENTWYRLVIKTIDNISTGTDKIPGFVIYLDGKPATSTASKGAAASAMGSLSQTAEYYNETGNLFPSMIAYYADNAQKLVGLGFRGTGNVDNIAFTTAAPADYAKDPTLATPIELTIDGETTPYDNFTDALAAIAEAEATSATMKLGKSLTAPVEGFALASCDLTINLNGTTLTDLLIMAGEVSLVNTSSDAATVATSSDSAIVLAEGTLKIGGSTGAIVVEGDTTVGGTLNILSENVKFKTLPSGEYTTPDGYKDALELVDGYYVLVAEGGSVTPTVEPGKDAGPYDDSAAAAAAAETAVVSITDTDAATAGQAEVAKVTVKEDNGKYYLTVVINTEADKYVDPEETMDAVGAQLSNIAGGTVTAVTIPSDKLTPGLYYYFSSSAEVDGTYTDQAKVLATGNAVTLQTGDKPSETAGFYKVNASLTK